MLLIDVHSHMDLDSYESYGGVDNLLDECKTNGVKVVICNGVTIESNRKVLDICARHNICKPALGIYPTHCLEYLEQGKDIFDNEIDFIKKQIENKLITAIGEVGLDYKEIKDMTLDQKNQMKECLRIFLELSKKYDLPIIIHSRGAELETIEFLEINEMKNRKVIMHCFSGRKHHITRIKENGWYFSIPCNINRSEHFQSLVKDVSLERLFTETDSPLLSPEIGKVNRPDNVIITIKKIAEIKKMDPEEVANIIYNNYQKVFMK